MADSVWHARKQAVLSRKSPNAPLQPTADAAAERRVSPIRRNCQCCRDVDSSPPCCVERIRFPSCHGHHSDDVPGVDLTPRFASSSETFTH
jgi:hypothetical protein